jgi:hypothetical protein
MMVVREGEVLGALTSDDVLGWVARAGSRRADGRTEEKV